MLLALRIDSTKRERSRSKHVKLKFMFENSFINHGE